MPHIFYAVEIWQFEKFQKKFDKHFLPIYFGALKKFLGLSSNVSSSRLLLAVGAWHPQYTSMWRFLKQASLLMHQYEQRQAFDDKLPEISATLKRIEQMCKKEMQLFTGQKKEFSRLV